MWQRMCSLFITLTLGGVLYTACAIPSSDQVSAQNPTCPTRPVGDNSNACASTAFVQAAVGPSCTTLGSFVVGTGASRQCSTVAGAVAVVDTSLTVPTVYGGSAVGSSLTLQSTSNGAPTTDRVLVRGGASLATPTLVYTPVAGRLASSWRWDTYGNVFQTVGTPNAATPGGSYDCNNPFQIPGQPVAGGQPGTAFNICTTVDTSIPAYNALSSTVYSLTTNTAGHYAAVFTGIADATSAGAGGLAALHYRIAPATSFGHAIVAQVAAADVSTGVGEIGSIQAIVAQTGATPRNVDYLYELKSAGASLGALIGVRFQGSALIPSYGSVAGVYATLAYSAQASNFIIGNIVTGGTSAATAVIIDDRDAGGTGTLLLGAIIGTFQNGETITGSGGGSATVNGTLSGALAAGQGIDLSAATFANYSLIAPNFRVAGTGLTTIVRSGNVALQVRSQNGSGFTYLATGRISNETLLGTAGAINDFFTGTAAGDGVLYNPTSSLWVGGSGTTNIGLRIAASGGVSVGATADPGIGILNVNTGFRIANAATLRHVPRGNGTNFVSAQLACADLSDAVATCSSISAASLVVGTTAITSGTTTRILYNNAGVLGEYTLTGSGTVVAMQTSPQFTTPDIGAATGTTLSLSHTSPNMLDLTETLDSAAGGPTIRLIRNNDTATINDTGGTFSFFMRDNAGPPGNIVNVANMSVFETAITAGAVSATFTIQTIQAGALANRMLIGGGLYTASNTDQGTDTINATRYFAGGTGGLASATLTVRDSGGAADCNIVVQGGLITSSTC